MDFTKIFKSKARLSLFRLYYTNPDKEYYLRELERILSTPVSIIRKELVSLERSGMFKLTRKANLCYYSLNKDYPLYEELKNIVFKTVGIQGALKGLLLSIPGIETAFIYGSYAKEQDNAKSDVDLFIIGNIDEDLLLPGINELEEKLHREINYSLYSRGNFDKKKKEHDPFIENVTENQKIFLIGEEHDIS